MGFRRETAGHVAIVTTRAFTSVLAIAAALLVAASAAASSPASEISASLSTTKAGAKNVTLTISWRTELRCGRPIGVKTLVLKLPANARVPAAIPASAVLVGTRAATKVAVTGHTLAIALPPPRGMLCDSIRVGIVKIVVLPSAGLGNPKVPGLYTATLIAGPGTFRLIMRTH